MCLIKAIDNRTRRKNDELRHPIYGLHRRKVQICKSLNLCMAFLGTYGLDGYGDTMIGDETYFSYSTFNDQIH